jgi:hypothetical protein
VEGGAAGEGMENEKVEGALQEIIGFAQ